MFSHLNLDVHVTRNSYEPGYSHNQEVTSEVTERRTNPFSPPISKKGILIAVVKDHFGRMTSNHVLCLARVSGGASVYRLQLQGFDGPEGVQSFFNEAFLAMKAAREDENVEPMRQIYSDHQFESIKGRMDQIRQETIEGARAVLRAYGADFLILGQRFPLVCVS
jgi:hypothetical protein